MRHFLCFVSQKFYTQFFLSNSCGILLWKKISENSIESMSYAFCCQLKKKTKNLLNVDNLLCLDRFFRNIIIYNFFFEMLNLHFYRHLEKKSYSYSIKCMSNTFYCQHVKKITYILNLDFFL